MSFSFPIKSLLWFSFALLLFYLSGCGSTMVGMHTGGGPAVVGSGPPPQAPAKGYRSKHIYCYYPEASVY